MNILGLISQLIGIKTLRLTDAIASIGPGFKGPTYQELRGPLLRSNMREENDFMLDIKSD